MEDTVDGTSCSCLPSTSLASMLNNDMRRNRHYIFPQVVCFHTESGFPLRRWRGEITNDVCNLECMQLQHVRRGTILENPHKSVVLYVGYYMRRPSNHPMYTMCALWYRNECVATICSSLLLPSQWKTKRFWSSLVFYWSRKAVGAYIVTGVRCQIDSTPFAFKRTDQFPVAAPK